MDDTPPPLPFDSSRPDRYRPPLMAWIAWGIFTAVSLLIFTARQGWQNPYDIGYMVGGIVAMLVIPAALAMVVFRIAGRSNVAGTVTFFVIFGLMFFGEAAQFGRKTMANVRFNDLRREQQAAQGEMREALAQGKEIDSKKTEKIVAKASEEYAVIAANSSGRERLIAEAGKAYMEELLATKGRYDAAVAHIDAKSFWDLTKFVPGAPAAGRRTAVQAFLKANAELLTYQDESATALVRVLQERGASAGEVQRAVEGYRKGAGPRLGAMAKIRSTDAEIAHVMLDFIDFEEANHANWKLDASGKVILDEGLLARYRGLLARLKTATEQQAIYQKQALAAQN